MTSITSWCLTAGGSCRAYTYTERDIENTHVIVINGVSKLYGMTGFRIGWVIANRTLVEVMTNVQAQMTSSPPVVSQAAAEGALTGMQSVTENLRLSIQNNRDVLVNELQHVHRCSIPQARRARSTACRISAPMAAVRSNWRTSCSKRRWS